MAAAAITPFLLETAFMPASFPGVSATIEPPRANCPVRRKDLSAIQQSAAGIKHSRTGNSKRKQRSRRARTVADRWLVTLAGPSTPDTRAGCWFSPNGRIRLFLSTQASVANPAPQDLPSFTSQYVVLSSGVALRQRVSYRVARPSASSSMRRNPHSRADGSISYSIFEMAVSRPASPTTRRVPASHC